MSDQNYAVIDGKTINLSDETVNNLKRELGIEEVQQPEFGDIVVLRNCGTRLVLRSAEGTLIAVDKDGYKTGAITADNFYKPTGKNIFKDNALNLAH